LATIETQVADADDLVSKSRAEADAKEQRAKSDPALLMSVPKPQCHQTKSVNRDGKEVWGQVCTQDPRTKTISDNLARNAAERKAAYEAVAQAVAARNALGPAKVAADAAVRNAADTHAKAVKDSQPIRSPDGVRHRRRGGHGRADQPVPADLRVRARDLCRLRLDLHSLHRCHARSAR
jgi:hypothetical protein